MLVVSHTAVIEHVPMGVYHTEEEKKTDDLPSCNNCIHNGTWDCIKCSGFDRYERAR